MRCENCPRPATDRFCGARGPLDAELLIVGMAPGNEELSQGIPFVGASGRILARCLKDAGISIDQTRIINCINCAPLGKGDKISPEQWAACDSRFAADVFASEARVVMPLGGDALWRLAGLKGEITRWRGHLIEPSEALPPVLAKRKDALTLALPPNSEWIIPSLHPAFIMRKGMKPLPFLITDTHRVARALRGELAIIAVAGGGTPVTHFPAAGVAALCAADIETNRETNAITQIGLAVVDGGIVSGSWPWEQGRELTAKLLGDPTSTKVFHHAGFDVQHLKRAGVAVRGKLWDTMWAGQMIQPDLDKNLDTMSSLYLDVKRWKHRRAEDEETYNRMDVVTTLALVPEQRHILDEQGQLGLFERVTMPLLWELIGLAERGVRVDSQRRSTLQASLNAKLAELEVKWNETTRQERTVKKTKKNGTGLADTIINFRSNPQLKQLFYTELELPIQRKLGQPTVDKEAVQKLLKRADGKARELLLLYAELKKTATLLSNFFQSSAETVHPSYFPHEKDEDRYGTATGRLSAQGPNIQQIPKSMRSMYIPHSADRVFVAADFSQIELRIAAALSDDKALIEALKGDIHAQNMAIMRCDRTRAKNILYGTLFGAGPKKLYETLLGEGFQVTQSECKALQDALFAAYPRLAAWRREVIAQARQKCYIANPFGRRRYFYDPDQYIPEILNYLPQSTAADIMNTCVPAVQQTAREFGGDLTALIHDEALCEVPREQVIPFTWALREVLEQRFDVIAPNFYCPTTLTTGENWGEMIAFEQAAEVRG